MPQKKYFAVITWSETYNLQVSPFFATPTETQDWCNERKINHDAVLGCTNWEELCRYDFDHNRLVWPINS